MVTRALQRFDNDRLAKFTELMGENSGWWQGPCEVKTFGEVIHKGDVFMPGVFDKLVKQSKAFLFQDAGYPMTQNGFCRLFSVVMSNSIRSPFSDSFGASPSNFMDGAF